MNACPATDLPLSLADAQTCAFGKARRERGGKPWCLAAFHLACILEQGERVEPGTAQVGHSAGKGTPL